MVRKIQHVFKGVPTLEGAGVHLRRIFGHAEVPQFDPFLMLDDFRSEEPDHYSKGFPWHPHRGIETITYVLAGEVEHGDSLGNKGIIGAGDVQWMTAGSGIIHQEMPRGDRQGRMYGFQLWANLPAASKMMDPRYREVTSAMIPAVTLGNGTTIRIIAGEVAGVSGPVADIVIDPLYLDISVPAGSEFRHPTKPGHTVFAYIFEGQAAFGAGAEVEADNGTLLLFGEGDEIVVVTGDDKVRFLLVAGQAIGEPVAWRGPIVMNSQEELDIAFAEYNQGTFIKYHG